MRQKILTVLLIIAAALNLNALAQEDTADIGAVTPTDECIGGQHTSVDELKIGDFILFGKYDDEPILWRYGADDENGKLFIKDDGFFGKNFNAEIKFDTTAEELTWKGSSARKWLNSTGTSEEGEIGSAYQHNYLYSSGELDDGFLNDTNFTASDRKIIKTVTLWSMLPESLTYLSENGDYNVYWPVKEVSTNEYGKTGYTFYDISDWAEHYHGAAQSTVDKMFLLDEMQVLKVSENIVVGESMYRDPPQVFNSTFFLRTSFFDSRHFVFSNRIERDQWNGKIISDEKNLTVTHGHGVIHPAFYLDEDNAVILSGSGTKDDPYVITGEPEIDMLWDGDELDYDQPAVEHNKTRIFPFAKSRNRWRLKLLGTRKGKGLLLKKTMIQSRFQSVCRRCM